ncbi:hypothetical protein DICA4_D24916 [Diutina catenulata]
MEKLVANIKAQNIFHSVWSSGVEAPSPELIGGYSRVAVRNNSDAFYASRALVRYCNLDLDEKNYRILVPEAPNRVSFNICGLDIHPSGALLATYGGTHVELLQLPHSLIALGADEEGNAMSEIPVQSYGVTLPAPLVKFLWHPGVDGNCVFVTLTADNYVRCYDIRVSSEPVMAVNVCAYANLRKATATSIAFGDSKAGIAAATTLYVAISNDTAFVAKNNDSTSGIYAIYPFLPPAASLSVHSADSAVEFYEEAKMIAETVQERFPTIASSNNSFLNLSVLRHQAFAQSVRDQAQGPSPETSPLPNTYKPILQGPLFSMSPPSHARVVDICSIGGVDGIPGLGLVTCSSSNQPAVTVLAQLQPLIMAWTEAAEIDWSKNAPVCNAYRLPTPGPINFAEEPTVQYSRPRRGFGFVSKKAVAAGVDTQLKYWSDEFACLSVLASKSLQTKANQGLQAIVFAGRPRHVYLRSAHDVIEMDASALLTELGLMLTQGQDISKSLPAMSFAQVVQHQDEIEGLAEIEEKYLGQGSVLLSVLGGSSSGQIHLKEYVNSVKKKVLAIEAPKSLPLVTTKPSVSSRAEQIAELERVKRPLMRELTQGVDAKSLINPLDTTEGLSAANKVSQATVKETIKQQRGLVNLQSIVRQQVDVLKRQIDHVYTFDESKYQLDTIIGSDPLLLISRLNKVTERQKNIDKRVETLKDKLFTQVRSQSSSNSLPLSSAERAWFKELNQYTSLLSEEDDKSLVTQVDYLESQITQAVSEIKKKKKNDKTVALNSLKCRNQLKKLYGWLEEEGRLIDTTVAQVEKLSLEMTQK